MSVEQTEKQGNSILSTPEKSNNRVKRSATTPLTPSILQQNIKRKLNSKNLNPSQLTNSLLQVSNSSSSISTPLDLSMRMNKNYFIDEDDEDYLFNITDSSSAKLQIIQSMQNSSIVGSSSGAANFASRAQSKKSKLSNIINTSKFDSFDSEYDTTDMDTVKPNFDRVEHDEKEKQRISLVELNCRNWMLKKELNYKESLVEFMCLERKFMMEG